jgi:hypothetical protein
MAYADYLTMGLNPLLLFGVCPTEPPPTKKADEPCSRFINLKHLLKKV